MVSSKIQVQKRYQIEGEIGSGAMGTVYLAHDAVIDRRVVLKTLRRERFVEDDEERALIDEARSAGKINHPNLVTVYDVVNDLEADRIYLALEYVHGRTLRDVILEFEKLECDEAVDIALQMAAGLDHLHEAGLIHRDIKPSNILIDAKGTVKITDFGIARAAGGSQLEEDGSVFGTPPYMAPEQLLGLDVDARCDVFSLGVVTYEMLTGTKPFGGRTAREVARRTLGGELKPISVLAPEVPRAVCDVVERAMERETEARFPTMGAFARALAQAAGRPEDASAQVTSRLLVAQASGASDPSATELIGGRAQVVLGGLRRWAREPWAAKARLLALGALLVLVAGAAASWMLFERFIREPAVGTPVAEAELLSVQAKLTAEGRRLIESGELEAAGAVLTLVEQLAPRDDATRRLKSRLEAEVAKEQEAEAVETPERRPARTPSRQEAVEAVREVLEEASDDPVTAAVLAELDQTLGYAMVPAEATRLALSVSSERRGGTVMVRTSSGLLLSTEFKRRRRGVFGASFVEGVTETVDFPAQTEQLLVYVTVGSAPAELFRFTGPFPGGRRLALDVVVDGEGKPTATIEREVQEEAVPDLGDALSPAPSP